MLKRLGKALIATGAGISIGSNVIDVFKWMELGLPISAWTAIGLAVAFVGIAVLIHGQQEENEALKQQMTKSLDERIRSLQLQPSATTARGRTETTSSEIQSSNWQGLSAAEIAQVRAAMESMAMWHGHTDFDGLIDDQRRGKPLNGSCWRCNKPRFQKGDRPDAV